MRDERSESIHEASPQEILERRAPVTSRRQG
jgi:hypothetical protein